MRREALAAAFALALVAGRGHADEPAATTVPGPRELAAVTSTEATTAFPADDTTAETTPHPERVLGPRYVLEGIEVRGNTTTLARVVQRFFPFRRGDTLDVDDAQLELARYRLLGTGFFRDVQLSLRKGTKRGHVVLVIDVVERNTIVVNDVWLGLSQDADPSGSARPLTAYGGADVAQTNLAGTGMTLGGAFALAENQLALRSRFTSPQVLGTPWTADAQLLYGRALDFFGNRDVLVDDPENPGRDYAVVSYRRFGGLVGTGRDVGVSTRFGVAYRFESIDATLPRAASHRRGADIEPIDFHIHGGESQLSAFRATLEHDTRDQPYLPSRGVHVHLASDAALAPVGSDYPFVKLQGRASTWMQLPLRHVLRFEAFSGAIFGEAPLFEQFYVGDLSDLLPDRVLDLSFDRRSAPNFLGTQIAEARYGTYAARLLAEYRVPLYRGTRSVYGVDLFTSAGIFALATELDFRSPARGYSGLARAPIDLTFNFGLRADTAAGGFTFGIANLLGFIPVRREAQ